jgi:hypothetical protein
MGGDIDTLKKQGGGGLKVRVSLKHKIAAMSEEQLTQYLTELVGEKRAKLELLELVEESLRKLRVAKKIEEVQSGLIHILARRDEAEALYVRSKWSMEQLQGYHLQSPEDAAQMLRTICLLNRDKSSVVPENENTVEAYVCTTELEEERRCMEECLRAFNKAEELLTEYVTKVFISLNLEDLIISRFGLDSYVVKTGETTAPAIPNGGESKET